jgi:hypothetical protein
MTTLVHGGAAFEELFLQSSYLSLVVVWVVGSFFYLFGHVP